MVRVSNEGKLARAQTITVSSEVAVAGDSVGTISRDDGEEWNVPPISTTLCRSKR
jgi:hypothetical protein